MSQPLFNSPRLSSHMFGVADMQSPRLSSHTFGVADVPSPRFSKPKQAVSVKLIKPSFDNSQASINLINDLNRFPSIRRIIQAMTIANRLNKQLKTTTRIEASVFEKYGSIVFEGSSADECVPLSESCFTVFDDYCILYQLIYNIIEFNIGSLCVYGISVNVFADGEFELRIQSHHRDIVLEQIQSMTFYRLESLVASRAELLQELKSFARIFKIRNESARTSEEIRYEVKQATAQLKNLDEKQKLKLAIYRIAHKAGAYCSASDYLLNRLIKRYQANRNETQKEVNETYTRMLTLMNEYSEGFLNSIHSELESFDVVGCEHLKALIENRVRVLAQLTNF